MKRKPPKPNKPSRSIPEHIKRAVNARDQFLCRSCGVATEFIHYDHVFPFDLGGPTTIENIQSLCPKCNTSKGNRIQCHHCRHWMSPEGTHCPQCRTRFPYSKRTRTLAGQLEILFQRVGRAVVIGGAALALLIFLSGAFYVYWRVSGAFAGTEQSAHVQTVVNDSFGATRSQPAAFKIIVPPRSSNARVVGGYKVTAGQKINFYVLDGAQYERWSGDTTTVSTLTKREQSTSVRVRQELQPGIYYLLFAGSDDAPATVAAEFYLKYD